MVEPIFIAPYFLDYILPFVLIFTLIFAILQKTKLLGEDNRNVDVLIGLVVGLTLIAFPGSRSVVVLLMPFFGCFGSYIVSFYVVVWIYCWS